VKGWHQRLTIIGLLLILAGFVFALLFSWSVGHQPRLVAHDAYQSVFEEIVARGGSGEWREFEQQTTRSSVTHRRAADVHGHSINMGILLIMIGLFTPLASRAGARLLTGMAAAAITYPAGLFLQFLGLKLAGEVVSAVGAVGAVALLAAFGFKLSKAVDALAR
jgi:hypothetical protein